MSFVALLLAVTLTPLDCPPGTKQHRRAEGGRIDEQWCADVRGRRHGPHAFYYENGQRVAQELYVHGVQHGLTEYFFNDGTVWRSEEWKHGKKTSQWINPVVYTLTREQALALGAGSCAGGNITVNSVRRTQESGRGNNIRSTEPPIQPLNLTVPPQGNRSIIVGSGSAAGLQLNGRSVRRTKGFPNTR